MPDRAALKKLFYFAIEDEHMLSEAFSGFPEEVFAIAYKVADTEDVFVMTAETKQALDRSDIPYNLLAAEDSSRVAVFHTPQSREELADYGDALKALALAYRAIAIACVGVNGDVDLGFDLSDGAGRYTYFTAPAGHTFIWRLFFERDEAVDFLTKLTDGEDRAVDWAEALPLASTKELASYH